MKSLIIAKNSLIKTCFINLPESWTIALNSANLQPSEIILKLLWTDQDLKETQILLQWSGLTTKKDFNREDLTFESPLMEIDQTLADILNLENHQEVINPFSFLLLI